ncbi:MAG: GH92 family glycosyl hydrolase [Bacteroidales bacterium]|nr:GH92 family glycosyl hydrolase [Bacteroidales bacterium]MDD4669738.1 GH92 family glycosyl hydrolase [Bacteroidales bacterium]
MIKRIAILVLTATLPVLCHAGFRIIEKESYIKYVNPFVGTDFHGHTFPGAVYPFGMMQLGPDTREDNWDGCSGYHYSDSTIWGFSHTHLSGTGCADYCDILVMPVTDYEKTVRRMDKESGSNGGEYPADYIFTEYYKSPFNHKNEKASPGYYEVFLDKWGVNAQLTVGRRAGMHKYKYPKKTQPEIIIDLEHRDDVIDSYIEVVNKKAIQGYRQSKSWANDQIVYFYMEFSNQIDDVQVLNKERTFGSKAILRFKRNIFDNLTVKVGISSVSEANAKLNMESEVTMRGFNGMLYSAEKAWERYLSKIEVDKEATERDKSTFYTALYHTAISPCLYSDVNGEYRGMDRMVHKAEYHEQYTVFSLWDTFRALHPLFTIIERERTVDFIKSFLAIYDQCGKLPIWELSGNETNCMIGYHSISVIADAIAKGITDFDIDHALEAMVESSNKQEFGIDVYRDNGLVLAEKEHESVSKTLEYAYDDWCIAQVADYMRKKESGNRSVAVAETDTIFKLVVQNSFNPYTTTYNTYIKRAQFYKNIYDPSTGFMRPRINGIWLDPFNPSEVNVHYTEANSWQYSFHVPQDISGLVSLFGGEQKFDKRMDDLFSASSDISGWNSADMTGMIGQYVQGNEPSHHIAYLYSYIGRPWKSQKIARQIMTTLFTPYPDGLCGNEDCGQMSAWYVLSALGFYPVTPGSDIYVFGSPIFRKAVINLENGKKFTISAPANTPENIYISSLSKNDTAYSKSYFHHSDIMDGSTFTFAMQDKPDESFGAKVEDRPVSAISEEIVVNPWFKVENAMFREKTQVSIEALKDDYLIMYKIYNRDKDADSGYQHYTAPFTVDYSAEISAYCEDENGNRSFITNTVLNKVVNTFSVKITKKYSRQYSAGGDEGLIDGIRGALNFRLGGWQGYQNKDFEAVIDMKEVKHITQVGAGFLQDIKSWIWMPRYVEFYTSADGKNYSFAGRIGHKVSEDDYTPQIHDMILTITPSDGSDTTGVDARYIKVFAKNYGTIPKWHLGAGGQGYIFVDEVIIK